MIGRQVRILIDTFSVEGIVVEEMGDGYIKVALPEDSFYGSVMLPVDRVQLL